LVDLGIEEIIAWPGLGGLCDIPVFEDRSFLLAIAFTEERAAS
jgi:hypothetical protein